VHACTNWRDEKRLGRDVDQRATDDATVTGEIVEAFAFAGRQNAFDARAVLIFQGFAMHTDARREAQLVAVDHPEHAAVAVELRDEPAERVGRDVVELATLRELDRELGESLSAHAITECAIRCGLDGMRELLDFVQPACVDAADALVP
jgi:hypothetical protein